MAIVGYYKQGNVSVGVNKGSYEGKETTSYVVNKQKFNKESKTFEDSPFWNVTDLRDLMTVLFRILGESVKKIQVKAKEQAPVETPQEEAIDELPF